ncbi:MAG: spore germination protein GerW family protein [Vicinamibacterales bacterium]
MEHVESLLKTALGEIERVLTTKTVVGEPIELAGNTIVPLVAVGFGFGGGGGTGEDQKSASAKGEGAGTGGGGGIKPVAVVIVDKDGKARVEPIRAAASVVEKIGEAVAKVVETREGKGRTPAPPAS